MPAKDRYDGLYDHGKEQTPLGRGRGVAKESPGLHLKRLVHVRRLLVSDPVGLS
jgi:hypothetical protein